MRTRVTKTFKMTAMKMEKNTSKRIAATPPMRTKPFMIAVYPNKMFSKS